VRSGEEEPSPRVYRTALRDVIGHCLYGVDINPMAVELCKVTLWLEALEPGKPLSFLDHHIRCGNSLLGATPELIAAGLPDDAFEAIEGDDKAACASLKKLNRAQREGLRHMFIAEDTAIRERLHQAAAAIDEISDSRPDDIHRKEAAFRSAQTNYDFGKAWDLANLWCAAFVIKKQFASPSPTGVGELPGRGSAARRADEGLGAESATLNDQPLATQGGLFGGTEELPKTKGKKAKGSSHASSEIPIGITTQNLRDFVEGGVLPGGLIAESKRLADNFKFFHFHLAFPEVFAQGGFDVGLGNPPWDKIQPEEEKFFATIRPEIANAENAKLRKGSSTFIMGRNTSARIFAERAAARRWLGFAARRSPSPRPSPLGRGRHAPRLARIPAAGLVKVAFANYLGDKTCSFSPREKVRMRGKAACQPQAASEPSSHTHPGFTHYKRRGTSPYSSATTKPTGSFPPEPGSFVEIWLC
jgi:hypothetical protein